MLTSLAALPLLVSALPAAHLGPPTHGPDRPSGRGLDVPLQAGDVAATGRTSKLSFAELDEVLLWRFALTEKGRAALRQVLELIMVERLMEDARLEVSPAQLDARWAELDLETKAGGVAGGLEAYLLEQGIARETFREYLRLSIGQEVLARRALGIPERSPVTGEQQTAWLEEEIAARGYEEQKHPWEGGVIATCGDTVLTREKFLEHLRSVLERDELRQAAHESLLERRLRSKLPDVSDEALADAVDREIDQRRESAAGDPRYKGITYESLLGAQGLSIAALQRDPAIRSAALASLWMERNYDEDGLRAVYNEEREAFDRRFGEGAEVFAIVLKAARYKNQLNPRTFDEANQELDELAHEIEGLDEFQAQARRLTEDLPKREQDGLIGIVRRGQDGLAPVVVRAIERALDERAERPLSGRVLGPFELQGASVLLCTGRHVPAPSWPKMRGHIESELRRRLFLEALSPDDIRLWR